MSSDSSGPTAAHAHAKSPSPQPGAGGSPVRGKVLGITLAAALGGLLFGFDTSVINGAVDSIQHTFDLGSAEIGITVAITLIGCAIGAWFAGQLADVWGRKPVMVTAAILFVVSSIGSGLAFSDWDLMPWRFIGGLAIGIASVIAPAYIGEVAPARQRGALSSLQQLAITLGIFLRCCPMRRCPELPAAQATSCGGDCRPGAGCCWSASFRLSSTEFCR